MEENLENLKRQNEELKKLVLSESKKVDNLEVCVDSLLNALDGASATIQASKRLVDHVMKKNG